MSLRVTNFKIACPNFVPHNPSPNLGWPLAPFPSVFPSTIVNNSGRQKLPKLFSRKKSSLLVRAFFSSQHFLLWNANAPRSLPYNLSNASCSLKRPRQRLYVLPEPSNAKPQTSTSRQTDTIEYLCSPSTCPLSQAWRCTQQCPLSKDFAKVGPQHPTSNPDPRTSRKVFLICRGTLSSWVGEWCVPAPHPGLSPWGGGGTTLFFCFLCGSTIFWRFLGVLF